MRMSLPARPTRPCGAPGAKKINSAIFPGTQGGPLEHIIAAKAVAFGEALKPEFKAYQEQIVKNAKVLADELLACGFDLVSGGTDNHLMLVDLRNFNISGKEMEERLDSVYITVNKNKIPGDPLPASQTSGIRVGTPAVTTRGFKEEEMKTIARCLYMAAAEYEKADEIRAMVEQLCSAHPIY